MQCGNFATTQNSVNLGYVAKFQRCNISQKKVVHCTVHGIRHTHIFILHRMLIMRVCLILYLFATGGKVSIILEPCPRTDHSGCVFRPRTDHYPSGCVVRPRTDHCHSGCVVRSGARAHIPAQHPPQQSPYTATDTCVCEMQSRARSAKPGGAQSAEDKEIKEHADAFADLYKRKRNSPLIN